MTYWNPYENHPDRELYPNGEHPYEKHPGKELRDALLFIPIFGLGVPAVFAILLALFVLFINLIY